MKNLFIIAVFILLYGSVFAQVPPSPRPAEPALVPPPLVSREVSGIVKDGSGQTVIGALVTLKSRKDTLRTATNDDGIFIFKDVKLATFNVTVSSIGSVDFVKKYLTNDATKRVILDPIILKDKTNELNEVKINGTPSITYKIDTVEYRASDYHVRENATLDELLKKMEGMEVGNDGTLTHQGQQVTKARLNGKDYAGGNVAQVIQNLPADIVEKVQVVDDYGDQAARTGIKDGDPTKVLNITTLANKSIGNVGRFITSAGNNDRYNERLFLQRLNANQVISFIGNYTNSVNGVAAVGSTSTGIGNGTGGGGGNNSSGGTGGTTTAGGPSFNYRDQLSKTTQINFSYRYNINDVYSINNITGAKSYSVTDTTTKKPTTETTLDTTTSTGHNKSHSHNANFDYEWQPDSLNYVRIEPNFSYGTTPTDQTSNTIYRGFQNENINSHTVTTSTTPNYSATLTYQHLWKNDHRRNVSISYVLSHSNSQQNNTINENIHFFNTGSGLDSLVNRATNNSQINNGERVTLQYVEPLSKIGAKTTQLLEFTEAYIYRGYNTSQITSNISPSGALAVVDSLSNIYKYSFSQGNFAGDYRINTSKIQLSIGVRAITTNLNGNNIAKDTTTHRNDFYIIPSFRFQYQWTRSAQASINYQGNPTEPSFAELQPIPNVSNPQNPIYGNPKLKPSFSHIITTRFNDYIANSKFNFSLNSRTTLYQDQIVTNNIYVDNPIYKKDPKIPGKIDTTHNQIDQTHYLNENGAIGELITYNIAKQLNDRAYNLELNGTINYGYSPVYLNSIRFHQTNWDVNTRFGPRINPNTSLEINPYFSYDDNRSFTTVPSSNPNVSTSVDIKTTGLNLEGRFFLLANRTFTIEYNLSKTYISGIPNYNKNPFVVNAYIEKEFFARKNGILRISAFDIFNQNSFVNYQQTATGYTSTTSNALSRYFLVSFI
jgi:hypothetical protein